VQEAQQTGTLEVLMTTSTPAPVLIFLSAFSAFAGKSAKLILFFAIGIVLFVVPLHNANFAGAMIIFLLSLAVALALGIFAAALQIAMQKGSAVIWLLGSVWFMTGTIFPVGSLPLPLRWAAWWIPVTHSLTGMREALLLGRSMGELAPEMEWLAAAVLVMIPASLGVFSWVLMRGRREGTLSAY